ncbi:MAG: nuclear transport factor 2 family protein [Geminicoccales bacterium]
MDKASVLDFLESYNRCFYERDLKALREHYVDGSNFVFWDNHPNCDSTSLKDHLIKIERFFVNGKDSESGDIEPLIVDNPRIVICKNTALLTAMLRYASRPEPGVRSTFFLVYDTGRWKAAHIHHSFAPSEQ